MNKPKWEDAPTWAEYLVQDRNGSWWWFEQEPPRDFVWRLAKGNMEPAKVYNWKNSMEKRP